MRLVPAVLLGLAAGLRSMSAPAFVTKAAEQGKIDPGKLGRVFSHPGLARALALGEAAADKSPKTPNRTDPAAFAARVAIGALAGAAIAENRDGLPAEAAIGALAAVAGTLGGFAFRSVLADLVGRDLPAALLEDGIVFLLGTSALAALSHTATEPAHAPVSIPTPA